MSLHLGSLSLDLSSFMLELYKIWRHSDESMTTERKTKREPRMKTKRLLPRDLKEADATSDVSFWRRWLVWHEFDDDKDDDEKHPDGIVFSSLSLAYLIFLFSFNLLHQHVSVFSFLSDFVWFLSNRRNCNSLTDVLFTTTTKRSSYLKVFCFCFFFEC